MLSKGQKNSMFIIGLVSLINGLIVAIPFRSVPGLNNIENIFQIEVSLKIALGVLAILLAIYPLSKKYQLIYNYRENSKITTVLSYFPMMVYVICSIVNVLHLISFDYSSVGLESIISIKFLGIFIAELVAYFFFAIYAILKLYKPMTELNKNGNLVLDIIIAIFVITFCVLNWQVGKAYSSNYQQFKEYRTGDPFVFFIFIFLIIGFGLSLKYLVRLFRKDEVLIYYSDSDFYAKEVMHKEYSRAYNDTLDDFELYFDDNLDDYKNMKIVQDSEDEDVEEEVTVTMVEDEQEVDEPIVIAEPTLEEINTTDSEEIINLRNMKKQVEEETAKKKEAFEELVKKQAELDEKRVALRDLRAKYDAAFAELQEMKDQIVEEADEPETPVAKKVKKIVPSFEKMVEYAKTFSDHDGFKVVANPKGNLLKFYIGKKMFLVMQSTNNDYRISFITTKTKVVEYLRSRPGDLVIPTNLKDNDWVKLTNKGKEEAKFMKKVIKESVQVAEAQIAEAIAAKEAEKKAKAAERAKERAAQRAAAKAASVNE